MRQADPAPTNPYGFGRLLFMSFGILCLSFLLDQMLRWSDPIRGLESGVVHIGLFGVFWVLSLSIWSLVIFGLYRWRNWQRFRSQWVLLPAFLVLISFLLSLVLDPPTPPQRFSRFAKTELPATAENLKFEFLGGGIADYCDTYYFETTPEEVDRLIREIGLVEDELYTPSNHRFRKLPDAPDPAEWPGSRRFQKSDAHAHWFHELITDATRTRVYIQISCT
jgi:hypothetical protein